MDDSETDTDHNPIVAHQSEPEPAVTPTATGIEPPAPPSGILSWADRVFGEVNKVFVGQRKLVRGVLTALLAEGHVLIESVPGLGKTLLVRVLGRVLGCSFNRIQFTPRPHALGCHRIADLRRTNQRLSIPPRPGVHPDPARR